MNDLSHVCIIFLRLKRGLVLEKSGVIVKRNKVIVKRNIVAVERDGLALKTIYVVTNRTAAMRQKEKVERLIFVDNHLYNEEVCLLSKLVCLGG